MAYVYERVSSVCGHVIQNYGMFGVLVTNDTSMCLMGRG